MVLIVVMTMVSVMAIECSGGKYCDAGSGCSEDKYTVFVDGHGCDHNN
jgi:hypothetical protein